MGVALVSPKPSHFQHVARAVCAVRLPRTELFSIAAFFRATSEESLVQDSLVLPSHLHRLPGWAMRPYNPQNQPYKGPFKGVTGYNNTSWYGSQLVLLGVTANALASHQEKFSCNQHAVATNPKLDMHLTCLWVAPLSSCCKRMANHRKKERGRESKSTNSLIPLEMPPISTFHLHQLHLEGPPLLLRRAPRFPQILLHMPLGSSRLDFLRNTRCLGPRAGRAGS